MELVFGDMNLKQLTLYLDDILIFLATFEEHLQRLVKYPNDRNRMDLNLRERNVSFSKTKVSHLGHVVRLAGVAVDPSKMERIVAWTTPSSPSELRSFLGMASYYSRFKPGFAKIAAPLHSLTGQDLKREAWMEACSSIEVGLVFRGRRSFLYTEETVIDNTSTRRSEV